MQREVIQNFLNLTGMEGIALMDGRSRPYFCRLDHALNFQQKEALVQGIHHVLATTPADFESFEFQFATQKVHIYKLLQGIVMLILTNSHLVDLDYQEALRRLIALLNQESHRAISMFRLVASEIPSALLDVKSPSPDTSVFGATPLASSATAITLPPRPVTRDLAGTATVAVTTSRDHASVVTQTSEVLLPPRTVPPIDPLALTQRKMPPTQLTAPVQEPAPEPMGSQPARQGGVTPVAPDRCNLKEAVLGLNILSQFTAQYLGNAVIVNYWKSSCPDHTWLKSWQVDRSAQLVAPSGADLSQPLQPEEVQLLREWVGNFRDRCTRVIRDFSQLLQSSPLDDRQRSLLL